MSLIPRSPWRRFWEFRARNWWQGDMVYIGTIIVLWIRPWA